MDQPTRPCEFCGTPLTARQKRCCGAPACKKAQLRANTRAWRDAGNTEKQETRTCNHCGGSFTVLARRETRYCSKTCAANGMDMKAVSDAGHAARVAAANKLRVKRCRNCGESFSGYGYSNFCSDVCRYVAAHGDRSTLHWHTCKTCKVSFCAPQETRAYCSKRCLWRKPRRWRKHAEAVHNRDAWTCWLCGTPTSPKWTFGDPLSPTLDHLIPRSQGGTDGPDNLATAHAICNALRSDNEGITTLVAPTAALKP